MERRIQSLCLSERALVLICMASLMCVCVMLYVRIHACTRVGKTKSQSIMHSPKVGQPVCVCVCHCPLSGKRAGACSPDKPPLAEEVLLYIGLFVAR